MRNTVAPPKLTVQQILDWADGFFRRHREWPHSNSGPIDEAIGETWCAIDNALNQGRRGLPGNSSLARVLAQCRGVFRASQEPTLTLEQILAWADAWHERVGDWPSNRSDRVPGPSGIRWSYVDDALRTGRCDLPGGSSLARLLAAERGCAASAARQGSARKRSSSGPISIFGAPARGRRATPARFSDIRKTLGATSNNASGVPDEGCQAAHRWLTFSPSAGEGGIAVASRRSALTTSSPGPTPFMSGPALGRSITRGPSQRCLARRGAPFILRSANGCRGLEGGSSLARLLTERRGVYNPQGERVLSEQQILGWADAWRARVGRWPTRDSGVIPGAGGMTWGAVAQALREGTCGLAGGSTLGRLLTSRRSVRRTPRVPHLTEDQIVAWADEHYRRTHTWPKVLSGPIFGDGT